MTLLSGLSRLDQAEMPLAWSFSIPRSVSENHHRAESETNFQR